MEADGSTMREIGEELGISAASVCRILKGAE
jgi:DNA-directed RNA polymerase specialized sigma subunit